MGQLEETMFAKDKKRINEKKQLKYFGMYCRLPLVLSIITLALFLLWAIIEISANGYIHTTTYWQDGETYFRTYTVYGVLGLESGAATFFIWLGIGLLLSTAIYFLGRILISYKMVQILYLEKLLVQEQERKEIEKAARKQSDEGEEETVGYEFK